MNIPYRGSGGPVQLRIDIEPVSASGSSEPARGITVEGGQRRVSTRSGGLFARRRLEIRAAEFTTSDLGDAPILPELLGQFAPGQENASVSADGALDTRKCHDAITARGASTIIPPRKNAKPWKPDTPGAIAMNEILRPPKRIGRTIWRRR